MKPMKRLTLLLLLSLCLLKSQAQQDSGLNLIEKVCQQAENKDLCISSIKANPDGPKSKDLTGLELVAIKVASSHAQDTCKMIDKLLKDTTLDPAVQQSLSDCSDHFLDAVEQLDDSIAALLANAYQDVHAWVEAAIADATLCEKAMPKSSGKAAEISTRSSTVGQLLNNILVINKQMGGN